jgi:hypothetical protein
MSRGTHMIRNGVLMAATLLLPAGLHAHQEEGTDPGRAQTLEARAQSLHDEPGRWTEAARLYREAAELREDEDEGKLQSLRMAAWMAHYAGRDREALENAEAAGRLALRRGDLVEAGEALADAAHLARATGQPERAAALAEEVRLLAGSPLLAAEDRMALLDRIRTPA